MSRFQIVCFAAASLLLAPPQFAQNANLTPAQQRAKAKAQNVPEIPYETVPNFLKLPPNLYLGEGIGVATNSKGHVFVYTRSQDTRLFEFDAKGNYLREIGEGLYGFAFAHAVRVDPQDNIWAVDEGTNMIIKFTPDGRVAMVLGHRPESVDGVPVTPGFGVTPPPAEPYTFNRPTDVAWDAPRRHFRFRRLRQLARGEVRQERADSSPRSVPKGRSWGSSICRTRWPPMRKATSTSATGPTAGSKFSTTT